jgi:branched-chain amino acid transport system substrate-binding protein
MKKRRNMRHESRRRLGLSAAAIAAVALAAAGCASSGSSSGAASGAGSSSGSGSSTDPGFTSSTVNIGTSLPLSGPAAAYGQEALGAAAYFDYINSLGGVKLADGHTYKIQYKYLDDAYDPSRTVTNVHQLVETFHPAILFNLFGTENVQAILKYAAQQQIPVLFAETGATQFLTESASEPWILSDGPSYVFEMQATVDYIDKVHPGANKIAVLYQGDSYGADIIAGLKAAVAGTKDTIVATQSYSVGTSDVSSQVEALSHSGANYFINEGIGTPATDAITTAAQIKWDVPQFIAYGSANSATLGPAGKAANGLYATLWEKDPTATQWASDSDVANLKKIAAKFAPSGSQLAATFYDGMRTAFLTVNILEHASAPTGKAIMNAALNLSDVSAPLIAGNLPLTTHPGYPYLITSMAMWQYDNGAWKEVSQPFSSGTP